jgi:hypothetical protein
MHPVIVVHFQPLLRQAIDSRPRQCHVCLASGPHARAPLLAVAGGGQPRPHCFHPLVPVLDPALTDVPVGRPPRLGLAPVAVRTLIGGVTWAAGMAKACRGCAPWRHVTDTGSALVCPAGRYPARRGLSYTLPECSAPSMVEATNQGALPIVWGLAAAP